MALSSTKYPIERSPSTVTSGAVTSTSRTYKQGELVIANYAKEGTSSFAQAFQITNSGTGQSWNLIDSEAPDNTSSPVAAWWCIMSVTQAMTISCQHNDASLTYGFIGVEVVPLGYHATDPFPSGNRFSGNNSTDVSQAVVPTSLGSMIRQWACDWNQTNSYAAAANCSIIDTDDVAGAATVGWFRPTTDPRPDTASFTIGETDTAGDIDWLVYELQSGPSPSIVSQNDFSVANTHTTGAVTLTNTPPTGGKLVVMASVFTGANGGSWSLTWSGGTGVSIEATHNVVGTTNGLTGTLVYLVTYTTPPTSITLARSVSNTDGYISGSVLNVIPLPGQAVTLDVISTGSAGTSSSPTDSQLPNVAANALVIGVMSRSAVGGTIAPATDWFQVVEHDETNNTAQACSIIQRISTSSGGLDPAWTLNASDDWVAAGISLISGAASATLSSPTGTEVNSTSADVGATTDQGSGTLYAVITTSSTAPTATQVKAGQDHTGAAAITAGTMGVASTGALSFRVQGLLQSTGYYAHLVQNNANGDSNVVTSSQFTTSSHGVQTSGTGPRSVPVLAGGPTASGTVGQFNRGVASTGPTAALSVTEQNDALSSAVTVALAANESITEQNDRLAATTTVTVTANESITEQNDQGSSSVTVTVTANEAVVEQNDRLAAQAGSPQVIGDLSIVEQNDVASGAVSVAVTANESVTEQNDQGSSSVAVAITANESVVEQSDRLAATAAVALAATENVVEQADRLSSSAAVAIGASSNTVEQNDTLVSEMGVIGTLTLAVAEQNDTLVATGTIPNTANVAIVEQNDLIEALGVQGALTTLSLAIVEQADQLAASGSPTVGASLNVTEQRDVLSAAMAVSIAANLAITEGRDTLSASMSVEVGLALSIQEAGDRGAATATVTISMASNTQEANDTLAALAGVIASGAVQVVEQDDLVTIATAVNLQANLAVTEERDTVSSRIMFPVLGTAFIVEQDDVLSFLMQSVTELDPSVPIDGVVYLAPRRTVIYKAQGRMTVYKEAGVRVIYWRAE